MAIKTYQLIKLQELGILYQDDKSHWFVNGLYLDCDITDELFAAGMFEH